VSKHLTPTQVTVQVQLLTDVQRARAKSVVLHALKLAVADIEQHGIEGARGLILTDPEHNVVGRVEVVYLALGRV
jgi:hypothetical protein